MNSNLVKIFIISFFSFTFFVFYLGLDGEKRYDTKNIVNKKISNFEINSLKENKIFLSSDLTNNNFTLINIWASWCSPCRKEHKYLLKLKNSTNIKILGINFKDNKNNALLFLEKLGDPYHYSTQDLNGKLSISLGAYGVPESILINNKLEIICSLLLFF